MVAVKKNVNVSVVITKRHSSLTNGVNGRTSQTNFVISYVFAPEMARKKPREKGIHGFIMIKETSENVPNAAHQSVKSYTHACVICPRGPAMNAATA